MTIENVRLMLRLEREQVGADDGDLATPLPLAAVSAAGFEPAAAAIPPATRPVTLELLEGAGGGWAQAA